MQEINDINIINHLKEFYKEAIYYKDGSIYTKLKYLETKKMFCAPYRKFEHFDDEIIFSFLNELSKRKMNYCYIFSSSYNVKYQEKKFDSQGDCTFMAFYLKDITRDILLKLNKIFFGLDFVMYFPMNNYYILFNYWYYNLFCGDKSFCENIINMTISESFIYAKEDIDDISEEPIRLYDTYWNYFKNFKF